MAIRYPNISSPNWLFQDFLYMVDGAEELRYVQVKYDGEIYTRSSQSFDYSVPPYNGFEVEPTVVQIDNIANFFDGVQTSFALTVQGSPLPAAITSQQLLISIGGILQYPNQSYTYSSGTLTFLSPPLAGYVFDGRYLQKSGGGSASLAQMDDISSSFDGVAITFPLRRNGLEIPNTLTSPQTLISIGGVLQDPNTYSLSSSTITFSSPPVSGYTFNGRYLSEALSENVSFFSLDDISNLFDGEKKQFQLTSYGSALPAGILESELLIYVGGVLQFPGLSYTYVNSVITFFTAPASSFSFNGRFFNTTGVGPTDPRGGQIVATLGYSKVGKLITITDWEVNWRDEWPLRLATNYLVNCLYTPHSLYSYRVSKDPYPFWVSEFFNPISNSPADYLYR